jgi:hypothetical protein
MERLDVSKVTANNVPHEGEYLGGNGIKICRQGR